MTERPADGRATDGDLALRAHLERLLPSADAALLARALSAEAARGDVPVEPPGGKPPELPPPARELRRVREQFALGAAARMLQHAMNNPLAALLAEAQLLELEAAQDAQRLAATRMVALVRRLATIVRRLDDGGAATPE